MQTPIELLAPAQNLACAKAAIAAGADAIYMGGPSFSARESATNSLTDIKTIIQHAHIFQVKVYIALNTLLTDNDLNKAVSLMWDLHSLGVNAIIIQDMGLLECDLPPIPIFASTQTTILSPEKAVFLENVGFKRIILERALTLNEIRAIHKKSMIELECFIHGSICVSYSGQCYLSYASGGRSGNRGNCAQPCRKPYQLIESDGTTITQPLHLLSMKDLDLSDHLNELLEAGVTSFKIEGRLKNEAYVSNVIAFYRYKLDTIFAHNQRYRRASIGISTRPFIPNPEKTFHRASSTYFLHERPFAQASLLTPKSTGQNIGHVIWTSSHSFRLHKNTELSPGDGLCFFDSHNQLTGTQVERVEGTMISPSSMKSILVGKEIYRNEDRQFIKQLSVSPPIRKISIDLVVLQNDCYDMQKETYLEITDDKGNSHLEKLPTSHKSNHEQAYIHPLTEQKIKEQLLKLGNTIFECRSINVPASIALYLPIQIINEWRRLAISKFLNKLQNAYKTMNIETHHTINNPAPYPTNEDFLTLHYLNQKAKQFYQRHGVTLPNTAFIETRKIYTNDRLMITRYCILHELNRCLKINQPQQLNQPLYLINDCSQRIKLAFDCERCEMQLYSE